MYDVTESYYSEVYLGEPVETEMFPRLCRRAEEIIEQLTAYNLSAAVFRALSDSSKDLVRKAICAQIEYLDINGGSEIYAGSALQNASLGKFSYSSGGNMAGNGAGGKAYAPLACAFLAPTGLLYKGR